MYSKFQIIYKTYPKLEYNNEFIQSSNNYNNNHTNNYSFFQSVV